VRERLGIVAAEVVASDRFSISTPVLGLSAAVTPCPLPGWVPVIATDPKDSLAAIVSARPCVGFVVVIAGTGLAHRIAGLIRSLADLGSCLITVLPRGDRIQAGADTYRLH
jgi:hypothetical protein